MAKIVGGFFTSHVPAIGNAIAKKQQNEPYWKPFFDAFPPVREWIGRERPEIVVFFYNDHGLNFFLDKMPTFAVGAASDYVSKDEGWGIPTTSSFKGDVKLSWHIINGIVADGFDPVMCQEMAVDHAITNPMLLMYPDSNWPVRIVPIAINSIQHPLPGPKRCYDLGRAVGRAIESWGRTSRCSFSAAAACRTSSTARGRVSSTRNSIENVWMRSRATSPRSINIRRSTSSRRPARKAWS